MSRSTVIVLLLVTTLVMTGTLAWEAQQAARSHRATAENVLRDYSRFAAWELSRVGRQQLLNAMHDALGPVQAGARAGRLDAAVGPRPACRPGCGGTEHTVLTAFSATLPDAQFTFAGATAGDDLRRLLSEEIAAAMRRPEDFTCPSLRAAVLDGQPRVVLWRPIHDRSDRLTSVVGIVTGPELVVGPFEKLLRDTPLLPPTLVPAEATSNGALAVRVASPDGDRLFASDTTWSPYEGSAALSRDLGGLQLAVALRPAAAQSLVIGGLPRERLPMIAGVLTLTVALVVVAVVQLRRETELSRMRSDFVSGVSHELRTPLAQIRMFSETLLLGRVRSAAEGQRSLAIIARETERLIQLVENVLVFSRSERREPRLSLEPASLAPIVGEVVESFAPLAGARQARIVMTLDEQVSANVDPGALRRVVLNLLDNAVKYGPAGQTIDVTLSLDEGTARLAIDDEGPGIEPADAERIWQPFKRLARSSDATGGAGIGLAIVRQLTILHGGRATVERAPHGGARFMIELPGAWRAAGAATAVA